MPALQDDAAAATSDCNEADALRHHRLSIGTMGALRHVVEGLRELPGRKSCCCFPMAYGSVRTWRYRVGRETLSPLRSLADGQPCEVEFSTIDARGLMCPGLQAKDNVGGDPMAVVRQITARSPNFAAQRAGLAYLAQETGGVFYKDDNDLRLPPGRRSTIKAATICWATAPVKTPLRLREARAHITASRSW